MVCSIGRLYNKAKDYASDNHYSRHQGLSQSYWFGQGAKTLGLDGSVSIEGYNNAHQGLDSKGHFLRQRQSGKKYNPGRDITLSAPKSVTLLGLVKEDKAVIEAHQQAVKTTLSYIEQNCIFTRTGKGGANHIQTDNALFAVFQHDDNRNLDPQLHSHCVIFNQTEGKDGKWRSMDNRQLYQQKMTIGQIYHHDLARGLEKLGYELDWHRDGTFDVRGYSQSQLREFSTRKIEIEKAVGRDASAVDKAKACTITRRAKVDSVSQRESIRQTWQQQARKLQLTHPKPNIYSFDYSKETVAQPNRHSPRQLVSQTIEQITAQDLTLTQHSLLKESLRLSQGQHFLEDIQREIERHPDLLPTQDGKLTTLSAIRREEQNSSSIEKTAVARTSDELRINGMVSDHKNRDIEIQSPTSVLATTDQQKEALTKQIRQGLIEQQKLSQTDRKINILISKNLDKFSQTQADNYEVGDIIKFGRQYAAFDQDRYYRVNAINRSDGKLIIKDTQGQKRNLDLKTCQQRAVFRSGTRELRLGEQMKFTRTHYQNQQRLVKGQSFSVVGFAKDEKIEIKTKGKTQTLHPDSLLYSEYRYLDTLALADLEISPPSQKQDLTMNPEQFDHTTLPPSTPDQFSTLKKHKIDLIVASKYLVETLGSVNLQNPQLKTYKSHDGTEIKLDRNSLNITHRDRELTLDRKDHSILKNTFSSEQLDRQIKDRNLEMKKQIELNRSQARSRSFER